MSVFPVRPLDGGDDTRFTYGLVQDVARVLADHGYPDLNDPAVARGGDFVELQLVLFRFVYGPPEEEQ